MNRQSITCNRALAVAIGLNEAFFYHHIEHFVTIENVDNPAVHKENRVWTYGDYEYLRAKYFPYMSVDTLQKTAKQLVSMGLITIKKWEVEASNGVSFARRNWYTHNPENTEAFLDFWADEGSVPCSKVESRSVTNKWIELQEMAKNDSENRILRFSENRILRLHKNEKEKEEKKELVPRFSIAEEKPIILKRPMVKESVVKPDSNTFETDTRPSNWLEGIFKQFWGRPISTTLLKRLNMPVYAVFGELGGQYMSPMDFAENPTYGDLFRKWVVGKKNPQTDGVIRTVGGRKWVDQHICNYSSPEGFLVWAKSQGTLIRPVEGKAPITVTEMKLLALAMMDVYCNNLDNQRFITPPAFVAFYEANIAKVKTNDEFLILWENNKNE